MWRVTDFVLRGEFCPLADLRRYLDDFRIALGAERLMHLAFDHEIVMRSLCFALGTPADRMERLTKLLQLTNYRYQSKEINSACIEAGRMEPGGMRSMDQSWLNTLVHAVADIKHNNQRLTDEDRHSLTNCSWHAAYFPYTGPSGLVPKLGEVRALILADVPLTSIRLQGCEKEIESLAVATRSTAQANVRRDAVVMKQVADRLGGDESGSPALETLALEALAVAIEVTDSSGGAVYFLSSAPNGGYERRAHVPSGNVDYPENLPKGGSTALGWAVSTHRATQVPPGGRSKLQRRNTYSPQAGVELITPIAGPLAKPSLPAVGALSVFRNTSFNAPFSAYDLALLRNVALRLALFRTTTAASSIANALAVMRAATGSSSQADTSIPAKALGCGRLPKDISSAISRLEGPLADLAHSTYSHSVSLRLALPSRDSSAEHGLALVRVAVHPPERLVTDSYAVQQEADGGINWIVFRSGEHENSPRAGQDKRALKLRPDTASELCVPLRVEGMLVGTLNLESAVPANYDPLVALVLAFAAGIGRTLADARSAQTQKIIDRAALAMSRRHDIYFYLSDLEDRLEGATLSEEVGGTLETFKFRVRAALEEIRQPPSLPETGKLSLIQVLELALKDADVTTTLPTTDNPLFHCPLSHTAAQALMVTFTNVFRNFANYTATSLDGATDFLRRVRFGDAVLDKRIHAIVTLENYSAEYLDFDRILELFRYPLEGDHDELRLGAFLAGLNARRAGAKVHASVLSDSRTLRTVVAVPIQAVEGITF